MAIWTPARVAEDLRAGRLTESSKARYIVFAIIAQSVTGSRSLRDVRPGVDTIALFMCLVITLIGVWAAIRANAAGDGRAFVERYMCIGVSLWVYIAAVYIAIYYVIYVFLARGQVVTAETYPRLAMPYMRSLGVWLTIGFAIGIRQYVAQAARPVSS
jgi:hypothetical protein